MGKKSKLLVNEFLTLAPGRYGFRMLVHETTPLPARCAITILNRGDTASIMGATGGRGVVLDEADRYGEISVALPTELMVSVIGLTGTRPDGIEIEMLDLGADGEIQGSVDAGPPGFASDVGTDGPVVLAHVERRGDVRYSAGGWVGDATLRARVEGLQIDWPSCPPGLALSYRVALANGELAEWAQLGSFVGTRGKSLGITSVSLVLTGPEAARWSLEIEAVFGGAADQPVRGIGTQVVVTGRTGREFLTGLRIALSNDGASVAKTEPARASAHAAPTASRSTVPSVRIALPEGANPAPGRAAPTRSAGMPRFTDVKVFKSKA